AAHALGQISGHDSAELDLIFVDQHSFGRGDDVVEGDDDYTGLGGTANHRVKPGGCGGVEDNRIDAERDHVVHRGDLRLYVFTRADDDQFFDHRGDIGRRGPGFGHLDHLRAPCVA